MTSSERELTLADGGCLLAPEDSAMHSMRWTALAIAVVGASIAAPVVAQESPYCIKGCDFAAGRGDCSFATYQQCLATASGRDAWCAENPYFNAKASASDRSRPSRRRL